MKEKLNLLPVSTWRWTGVNWAGDAAALPTPPAEGWGAGSTALSPLPAGVNALERLPQSCAAIESGMGAAMDAFVAEQANAACFLTAEGKAGAPVFITHTLDSAHPAAVAHQAILARADSDLTVVEVCRAEEGADGLCAVLTQICAEAGAHVRLVQVQLLGDGNRRWSAVGVKAGAGATVELVRVELGGGMTACGSRALLSGEHSAYHLDTVYFGDGDRVLDFNDVAEHLGRETVSTLRAAGVLADRSDKILRGTIDFRRGAVSAAGHESEDVLLFSPTARNRTVPLILCGEERVEGQHAATIGRLDEGKLYYLGSRGLSPAQARRLMVEARFSPALEKIPDEALREEITAYLGRRLDAHA